MATNVVYPGVVTINDLVTATTLSSSAFFEAIQTTAGVIESVKISVAQIGAAIGSGGSTVIAIGATSITGGTTTRILYDNAGVVGEYTLTGTGAVVVMQNTPTLTTPVLGSATASSINRVTITAPAASATLTIADGKTLTVSNILTLVGSDGTVMTFPTTSATIARTDAAQTFVTGQIVNGTLRLGTISVTTGQLLLANSGSANLTIIQAGAAANARTYTWPTDFGAAGTFLMDAAANGTLSWSAAVRPGATSTLTVGYTVTPNNLGNITSFTVDPALGNYQYGTNHGAATWTAPASDCAVNILVTNDGSAGAITFTGFTVGSSTGDALTTTNGNKFLIQIIRINAVSTYIIKALQ